MKPTPLRQSKLPIKIPANDNPFQRALLVKMLNTNAAILYMTNKHTKDATIEPICDCNSEVK